MAVQQNQKKELIGVYKLTFSRCFEQKTLILLKLDYLIL